MIIAGVEEAGRGPVIGPMVMTGVMLEEEKIKKLQSIGVKDSKLLTPQKREELFDFVCAIVKKHHTIILSPTQIDNALESKEINLNWLEAITSAKILNKLRPDKAILDCPSNNIVAYANYVKNLLEHEMILVCEHKADLNHTIVAAASIIAKVTRDRIINDLKQKVGSDFGSGYPSDPKTQAFLSKNYDRYDIFRKSWSSYKRIVESKKQKGILDFK